MTVQASIAENTVAPATAARVLTALGARFGRDKGWALFREVTTKETTRRADAMAVNLWTNSRDSQVHGFEVKVSRGDWLNELKNPEKSAYFRDRCTFWWIAAGPHVVHAAELPPKWGLLVLRGDKLHLERTAENLYGTGLDVDLMTVLLRHAFDQSPSKELLQEARDAGYSEGKKRALEEQGWNKKYEERRLNDEFAEWQKIKPEFERESGVHLNSVNAAVAGQCYRLLYRSKDRVADARRSIESDHRQIEFMLEQHARLVDEVRKIPGASP